MRRHNRRTIFPRLAILLVAAGLILILLPNALNCGAQAQGRDSVGGARSSEARRGALMTADITPSKIPTERRVPYKKIKEDFEQLQVTNKSLKETGTVATLDYEKIRKDASEIKRRAKQLKKNLLLPEPAEEEKSKRTVKASDAEELRAMVNALDDLVKSFVQNPVLQNPNIVDAEGWGRARRDLESIIILSEQIQINAVAVSKANGKKL
jgi:hypothetical protein